MNFSEAYSDLFKLYCRVYEKGLKNIRGTTYLKVKLMDISDKWEIGPFTETICGMDITMSKLRHFDEYYSGTNVVEGYIKKRRLEEEDVIVDAGAYPGEFTIYAAKKGQKVIALEPDNENADELRKNLELNSLDNFEIKNVALGGENKTGFIKKSGISSEVSNKGSDRIQIRTMGSLFDNREIDFIKMDIEGKEIEVLKESGDFIQQNELFFAIASYHDYRNKKHSSEEVERIAHEIGYNSETGYESHKTTWMWN